jgi:hypothetical protein
LDIDVLLMEGTTLRSRIPVEKHSDFEDSTSRSLLQDGILPEVWAASFKFQP